MNSDAKLLIFSAPLVLLLVAAPSLADVAWVFKDSPGAVGRTEIVTVEDDPAHPEKHATACVPGCVPAKSYSVSAPVTRVTEPKANRIQLLGGYGPDGLNVVIKPGQTTVTPYYGPMLGLGYERLLSPEWSLSISGLGGGSAGSRTFVGFAGVGFGW